MHTVLFLDFESQCVDAAKTNVTEVGALLKSVDENGYALKLEELSQLCWDSTYPPQSAEVVEVTGITDAMLREHGEHVREVFQTKLFRLVEQADVVIAHNKSFDETLYNSMSARMGLNPPQPKKGWLCSIADIPYPKKYKCKKLSHLAYDHGIVVDPSTLHRALDDVKLLAQLMGRYRVADMLAYRDSPWVYLKAVTLAPWTDGGASNAKAKKLGYSYEKVWGTEEPVFAKTWVARKKENELEAAKKDASAVGLEIKRLVLN